MFRQIVSGYLGILRTIFRIVVLLAVCIGTGFILVWPLWRLADADPGLYSLIFGILVGALVLFLAGSGSYRSFRKNARKFLFRLASGMVLLAGLALAIVFVLGWRRFLAGITVLATLALYGLLAFGLAPDHRPQKS